MFYTPPVCPAMFYTPKIGTILLGFRNFKNWGPSRWNRTRKKNYIPSVFWHFIETPRNQCRESFLCTLSWFSAVVLTRSGALYWLRFACWLPNCGPCARVKWFWNQVSSTELIELLIGILPWHKHLPTRAHLRPTTLRTHLICLGYDRPLPPRQFSRNPYKIYTRLDLYR